MATHRNKMEQQPHGSHSELSTEIQRLYKMKLKINSINYRGRLPKGDLQNLVALHQDSTITNATY